MNLAFSHHVQAAVNRHGQIRRRDFLRGISLAGLAAGGLSWTDAVSLRADELRRRGRACILLWMQGGPSQFETFSPKPDHENGGPTRAIATSTPGVEISENLPRLAEQMNDLAVIRSMTSKEGNHQRATFLLHTGYAPNPSVKYPALGAAVSQQLAAAEVELPAFVRIGGRLQNAGGGGLLGVEFDPFVIGSPERPPENTRPTTDRARFDRRLNLLNRLETGFASGGGRRLTEDHRKLYEKASRMILSAEMNAFDLAQEPDAVRDAYSRSQFGQGCLLARRLVEAGVTFIEVGAGGWDTHQDNFDRTRSLTEQIDQPFARLIADLRERGLLDSTLVVWMGEFGRTPRINPRGGRDHYPRAFNVALAGGGVRGGQVIGRTDAGGVDVTDRPVTVNDLFQTVAKSLGIDADQENMSPIGRPIRVVDGGQAIDELFS